MAEKARVRRRREMTARMESQTMRPLRDLRRRIQRRERRQAPERERATTQQDWARSLTRLSTTLLMVSRLSRVSLAMSAPWSRAWGEPGRHLPRTG